MGQRYEEAAGQMQGLLQSWQGQDCELQVVLPTRGKGQLLRGLSGQLKSAVQEQGRLHVQVVSVEVESEDQAGMQEVLEALESLRGQQAAAGQVLELRGQAGRWQRWPPTTPHPSLRRNSPTPGRSSRQRFARR